jgi:hypothetical protein
MSSLMRQPGFNEVIEVPDDQHFSFLARGYIYLGPVPLKYDEVSEEVKPRKPKRKTNGMD